MSTQTQIDRLSESRDTIRTKLVSLGLSASDDKLDELATAVSNIAVKTSSDMTASGATVTAPAGYYKTAQSKSVATATQATPSVSINTSTGLITASATQTAGYVSSGTKSGTKQLTVQAAKTITPTTSEQTAVAAGVYTTGAVKVAAIPSKYKDVSGVTAAAGDDLSGKKFVTSAGTLTEGTIATKTSSDLTASGATVSVPAGYYASAASKSVATATQATPSISVSSAGLITASATQSAGYVASGTKSATKQLTTQAAKTVTPGTSNQTAVASGRYTTGAVTVKGDANLKAENIMKGVSIFGVAGSAESGGAVEEATNAAGGKTVFIDSENDEPGNNKVLPSGYTRIEYLESSGTQYIDTGFVPNQNTRLDLVATPLSVVDAGAGVGFIPYGAATGYNSNAFECYSVSSKFEFNYDGQYDSIGTVVANKRVTISHNKNNVSLTIQGAGQFSKAFTYQSFTAPYTLTLFAIHRSSVTRGVLRLHACQIYNNGTLVRDFVPAKNSSGTAGLYDFANGAFYTDAAGGAFIAGADVEPGVSRVVLNDETLIDLTADTVTPESLLAGFTAHNAMGQLIQGAAASGRPVATGTAQVASGYTYTVSGLPFKPVQMMFFSCTTDGSSAMQAMYVDEQNAIYKTRKNSTTVASTKLATLNNDGFTLGSGTQLYIPGGTSYWIAVGA